MHTPADRLDLISVEQLIDWLSPPALAELDEILVDELDEIGTPRTDRDAYRAELLTSIRATIAEAIR